MAASAATSKNVTATVRRYLYLSRPVGVSSGALVVAAWSRAMRKTGSADGGILNPDFYKAFRNPRIEPSSLPESFRPGGNHRAPAAFTYIERKLIGEAHERVELCKRG